ncbi:MAG TPA: L-carnitine dehydrogenase, partial [Gaiellaceae bacterium]
MTIRTVGLLGGGVIGGGWAARFLLNGYDVVVHDPDPEAPRKIEALLDNARRALAALTLAPLPAEGRLIFVAGVEEAAARADFVQESAPERIELKQGLLAAASRAARPDVVIASSTSGLRPTVLQRDMVAPERFTVGHPFNPVYLLPLVELCGGEATAPETLDRAAELYRAVGMRPLRLEHEIDGFIADRLLEALWREALWLVNDGVATVEEIDDAIRFGPGLRWSIMGTFLLYRIAGGEDGVRHFMAQFGPALEWPWTKLTDVPELTEELIAKLEQQSDAQAGGRSIRELERQRDDCLVSVLQALRAHDVGAGAVLREYEQALLAGRPAADGDGLLVHEIQISPAWIDYNGHTTESAYLRMTGDATDALLARLGVDASYVAAGGSYYTVETHL